MKMTMPIFALLNTKIGRSRFTKNQNISDKTALDLVNLRRQVIIHSCYEIKIQEFSFRFYTTLSTFL